VTEATFQKCTKLHTEYFAIIQSFSPDMQSPSVFTVGQVAINRLRLDELFKKEQDFFVSRHPRSQMLSMRAHEHLLSGVPMPWMVRWPGPFPIFVSSANGSTFLDVDEIEYVDFCLGDTGAMTGHGLSQVADAISTAARRGITTMLPNDDGIWIAEELTRRFGLTKWQFAMTATDANRFVLRYARALTGRPKIAVMDWCYHGTVDETLVIRDHEGTTVSRPGALGPPIDPHLTSVSIPFNDVDELDRILSRGDIACLLMEPALTNIGIVLPEDGYLEEVRRITRAHGVFLVIDETHTICAGPGGCTKAWTLEPDFFVIGKPIGGGMPAAVYGMSAEVATMIEKSLSADDIDVSGVGGTLTGNALALAAVRATLSSTLRESDYDVMIPLATQWASGVQSVIDEFSLDWHVQQLGCRAEYWFCAPPRNGAEAARNVDHDLDAYLHLYAMNRGFLLTPFHNMALFSPFHNRDQVDSHTVMFRTAVESLLV
jgi:glutamate-1-semialdehyde 2,1-aminomutase